jgi:transcription antitermination factor NusG
LIFNHLQEKDVSERGGAVLATEIFRQDAAYDWRLGGGMPRCWYALRTRSNFERNVATELADKRIENYLPSYEEVHQWKDRKKTVQVPLFPGYVFARFPNCSQARVRVLQTRGVVRILGVAQAIEPIPEDEIEAVRHLLRVRVSCYGHPYLREGDRVRVRKGPLRGLEGILVRIKNRARLVVSVNLIMQSVAAEVEIGHVEPIPSSVSDRIRIEAPCIPI